MIADSVETKQQLVEVFAGYNNVQIPLPGEIMETQKKRKLLDCNIFFNEFILLTVIKILTWDYGCSDAEKENYLKFQHAQLDQGFLFKKVQ